MSRSDILKWLDVPPAWLMLFLVLARIQAVRLPVAPLDHPLIGFLAGLLVGGGVLLTLVAVIQMRQNHTTFVPHRHARQLVTNGVFARSRNPIYLGDAMVLTGLIVYWNAWPSLVLVPLFLWVITDRFVLQEEAWLAEDFGPGFEDWSARVRRWL
ncbi:isoprenylcysteine carboxylmethyltransferase family protein [Tropicimonas sp. IMCC34043]|uniref:methyltransferase family protein n=1 Tax=Tropicimonas sp. IMCC34043 TaxID=2248760 RepID=UPI001E28AAA2|nr:isoprenylcysteine carboxylmethyltransferase family protein [Tropicimonas sp. IMCC34043]